MKIKTPRTIIMPFNSI